MFLIRQAQPHDLDDLHALAKQTYFINLPPDREIISAKIAQSAASFRRLVTRGRTSRAARTLDRSGGAGGAGVAGVAGVAGGSGGSGMRAVTGTSDLFLLVLEDVTGRGVIGTSQVIARMGGAGSPRVCMRLEQRSRRSESLKTEWTHTFARIETDATGPTEIGGLIINHAFRGHRLRLGRFLSYARFHLVGLFRERFAPRIVAEMLGPIDKSGYNPFFERFMRHYIPRSFAEVYRFSQTSKEFVTGLMPEGAIDISILDPEVTHAAGDVAEETRPARAMLERLGFKYHRQIDPLDGGPHLEARTAEVLPVRATRRLRGVVARRRAGQRPRRAEPAVALPSHLLSTLDTDGQFRCVQCDGVVVEGGRAMIPAEHAAHLLGVPRVCGVTPY